MARQFDYKIDGVDFTDCVQYTTVSESIRDVEGPNGGTTLDGKIHRDIIARKYDFVVTIKPVSATRLAELINALTVGTHQIYRFSGYRNRYVTSPMFVDTNDIKLLMMKASGVRFYGDMTLTHTEQ